MTELPSWADIAALPRATARERQVWETLVREREEADKWERMRAAVDDRLSVTPEACLAMGGHFYEVGRADGLGRPVCVQCDIAGPPF